MTDPHSVNVDEPVETNQPSELSEAEFHLLEEALKAVVDHSATHTDVSQGIHAPTYTVSEIPWLHTLIPGMEKLLAKYHMGNFVVVRETNEEIFEYMPLYARIGMHLLFYGKQQVRLLGFDVVQRLLQEQSIKQGKIYDSPESAKSIPSFVRTYSLHTDELLEPDLSKYKCFNDFFSRKLRDGTRPVQNEDDPAGFCSAADCRLTVYQSVDLAKQFWIKGNNFNIPNLLNVSPTSNRASAFKQGSLAIFRLAPSDYHRFHSPLDGTIGDIEHVPGQYYTVNPQAVNEPGFDVFTANTRSILYIKHTATGLPVAFVAVGALLVGSIKWTGGSKKGELVKRGDELGYFAYGGSTIVAVFPRKLIEFDQDLIVNSNKPIETLVKVGYSIGRCKLGTSWTRRKLSPMVENFFCGCVVG